MLLYEIRPKQDVWAKAGQPPQPERTYLVAAEDTYAARDMVIRLLKEKGGKELTRTDLEAKPAREDDARQRQIRFENDGFGGWRFRTTAWKAYQRCKESNKPQIITNYIC